MRPDNEVLTVDVHIIAATNRNIEKAVAEKEFREDPYYRLKGMMFHLLPLRERPEDIAPLVAAFIKEFSAEYGKNITGITPEALTRLERAAWPGNIRQLRSTIQAAVALATTDRLESKDFPDIYPEFIKTLISIWQTLPPETQNAIWETLHPETQHNDARTLDAVLVILEQFASFKHIPDERKRRVSQHQRFEPASDSKRGCPKTCRAVRLAPRGS